MKYETLEYTFDSFKFHVLHGLSNINNDTDENIKELILAAHIYDSLSDSLFVDIPQNKTQFFLSYLSIIFQQWLPDNRKDVKELFQTIKEWKRLDFWIDKFGYFSIFIQAFFQLYQISTNYKFLEFCLVAAESYRENLNPLRVRIIFWSHVIRMFELGIPDLVYSRQIESAFNLLEQITARGFLDLFFIYGTHENILPEASYLEYHIMDFLENYTPISTIDSEEAGKTNSLESIPTYSREQLLQFIDSCSIFHKNDLNIQSCHTFKVNQIIKSLEKDTAYLAFHQIDEHLFCAALRFDGNIDLSITDTYDSVKDMSIIDQECAKVISLIRHLNILGLPIQHRGISDSIKQKDSYDKIKSVLMDLYTLLFREHDFKVSNNYNNESYNTHDFIHGSKVLLISSAFPIQSIPFPALHDGKSYLIDKMIVAYVPNATWYAAQQHKYKVYRLC